MNYRKKIKKYILQPLRSALCPFQKKPRFFGWGLASYTNPPWDEKYGSIDDSSRCFLAVHNSLKSSISELKFQSTQFHDMGLNVDEQLDFVDQLMWRHYYIYKTVELVSRNSHLKGKAFLEFGVSDGVTSFFALNSAKKFSDNMKFYLYDSWSQMNEKFLTKEEILDKRMTHYGYLEIDTVKKNLFEFEKNITYIQGFIPESFDESSNPKDVAWIHIDLNSTKPTMATLEVFCNKIASGGVVLFDDYAWDSHKETKIEIDRFFSTKAYVSMPLATGQGLFIKL